MSEVIKQWRINYMPNTYRICATEYNYIGTEKDFEKWFEETCVCSFCKLDLELSRADYPDDSAFNTGCGCEWEISDGKILSEQEIVFYKKANNLS